MIGFYNINTSLYRKWDVSLVRSWWESAHIQFNLWLVYYMFLCDGTWCHFHHEGSCIQCRQLYFFSLWYLSGHIQYLRHTVSIGYRFAWLYINCFQSPWFQRIMIESGIFPWWVVSRRGGGTVVVACFLRNRMISRRGNEQRKGNWYTFSY